MEDKNIVVSMRNITKIFGKDVIANNNISLDIFRGEILSILGENGSGKTTLMNMLAGIYYPDSGEIFINSKKVSIASPKDAFNLGIGMVHQHFKLVDILTATENIVLGLEGRLDINAERSKVVSICEKYGFNIDPDKKIYDMTVSEKQTVEIVKVLYRGADILIFDEPTAVLTPQEVEKLFNVMRNMKKAGKSLVIITHKLGEIQEIADRVLIMRRGEYVDTLKISETDQQMIADMMVGHKVNLNIEKPEPFDPFLRLKIKKLNVKNHEGVYKLKDVSFDAYAGEILGVAGISGSGQKELLETLAGLQKAESGSVIYLDNDGTEKELLGHNSKALEEMGIKISFVPEDRLGMGLVGNMNIPDNMMLRTYKNGKSFFTERKTPLKQARQIVHMLKVETPGLNTPIRRLSGGNVQKVLVGREIAQKPKIFMCAYPVRGLDINSSLAIYELLNYVKLTGAVVILVGEDLDVLLEISDRIMVLCDGCVNGILDGKKATKNELGLLMTYREEVTNG